MIGEILESLGLEKKEKELYQKLIEIGPSGASTLAKELNMPRQSAYSILQKMFSRGLIEQTDNRGSKVFIADPNHLLSFIDNSRKALNQTKIELEKTIPKLMESFGPRNIPKLRYYDGKTGLKRLLENILEQYKSSKTKDFRGYGINRFKGVLDDFLYEFVKKRHSYGVSTKLFIANEDDDFQITNESNRYGRTVKHLNINQQKAGLYLVGNRAYLFSYESNVGVMIEDNAIAKLLTDVFDSQWRVVKE